MPTIELSLYQQVKVQQAEDQYYLESAVKFTAGQLSLVLLSELGQRIATIEYDGTDVKSTRATLSPIQVDPYYVLEAMQMIYWPLTALSERSHNGRRFIEAEDGKSRQIYYHQRLIINIDYDTICPLTGKVRYHNRLYNLHLLINSQVVTDIKDAKTTTGHNAFCSL